MFKNRFFGVLVVVALLAVAALTAWEAAAIADVVSDDQSAPALSIESRDRPVSEDTIAPAPSHRSPGDECFDVSLSELADCRLASQKPIETGQDRTYPRRHPLNECFDVPISEVCDK
jgi:hypothetical protein